jgi:hypothetical protein
LLYRKIRYGYEFRRIPLTKGKYAIVDLEDYDKLAADKWHLFEKGIRTIFTPPAPNTAKTSLCTAAL